MSAPRILFLDIETSPDLVYVWRLYDTSAIAVKEHWKILSFSAEWLGGGVVTKGLCDYEDEGDGELLEDLWELLNEADIVVAHNGTAFDVKKVNARMIYHEFPPPAPFKVVDTLRETRKIARFSSNKLDWLGDQLDLGKKIKHEGFPLWEACMNGDEKAWKRMLRYNRKDVILLKKLYKRLTPWMAQPASGLWVLGTVCANPACASRNLERRGFAKTRTRVYQRFVCKVCGKWSRSVIAEPSQKASLVGA